MDFQVLITVLIIAVIFWRAYGYVPASRKDQLILMYWNERGCSAINVQRLTTAEKLKYGVPPHPLLEGHNMAYSFITGKDKVWRKVELLTENGTQNTLYVEATFENNGLTSCEEFDSYEI